MKTVSEIMGTEQSFQHVNPPHCNHKYHSDGVVTTALQEQRDAGSGESLGCLSHFLKEPWAALQLSTGFSWPRSYSNPPSWLSTILATLTSFLFTTGRECQTQKGDGSLGGDKVDYSVQENGILQSRVVNVGNISSPMPAIHGCGCFASALWERQEGEDARGGYEPRGWAAYLGFIWNHLPCICPEALLNLRVPLNSLLESSFCYGLFFQENQNIYWVINLNHKCQTPGLHLEYLSASWLLGFSMRPLFLPFLPSFL